MLSALLLFDCYFSLGKKSNQKFKRVPRLRASAGRDAERSFSSKSPLTNSRLGESLDRRAQGWRLRCMLCDDTKGAVFFDLGLLVT
jgi:hypothetical protein